MQPLTTPRTFDEWVAMIAAERASKGWPFDLEVRAGALWMNCPHPGHPDTNPSFTLKVGVERILAKCWSADSTDHVGEALSFYGLTFADLDRLDGVREAAPAATTPRVLSNDWSVTTLRSAFSWTRTLLADADILAAPKVARHYLDADAISRLGLGLSNGRLAVVVTGADGRPSGLQRLAIDGSEPKALTDRDGALAGFLGLPVTGLPSGATVVVTEGASDGVSMAAHVGISLPVFGSGNADKGLRPYLDDLVEADADVVVIGDRDDSGVAFVDSAVAVLRSAGLRPRRAELPVGGDDVTDLLAAYGPAAFADAMGDALRQATTPPRTWPNGLGVTDLGALIAAGLEPCIPSLFCFADAPERGLVYPGEVSTIAGKPGAGKTTAALFAASQALADGHRVVVLDFENGPMTIARKLRALNVPAVHLTADRLIYANPSISYRDADWPDVLAAIEEFGPGLVLVDGVNRALTLAGGSFEEPKAVQEFYGSVSEPIARRTGAGVLQIDHLAKGTIASHSEGAIGSVAKTGDVGGAVLIVEVIAPIRPGNTGRLRIWCPKDRQGGVLEYAQDSQGGYYVADLIVEATPGGLMEAQLVKPQTFSLETAEQREESRILEIVKTQPGIGAHALRETSGVTAGPAFTSAIARLVETDALAVVREGSRHAHYLVADTPA